MMGSFVHIFKLSGLLIYRYERAVNTYHYRKAEVLKVRRLFF